MSNELSTIITSLTLLVEGMASIEQRLSALESTPTDAMSHKASEPTTTTTNKEIHMDTTTDIIERRLTHDTLTGEQARRKLPKSERGKAKSPHLVKMDRDDIARVLAGGSFEYVAHSGNAYRVTMGTTTAPTPRTQAPAPAPTDEIPLAERVCALLESAPRVKVTPQQVAEKLGITVRQARTQLNVLTNNNRPSPRHGRIVRVTDGVYACAKRG